MRNLFYYIVFVTVVLSGLTIYSCANRGYPEGGPKDEKPPVIIGTSPENGSLEFNNKRVNIYFNEFVQLKEINEKFMISPPQKKKPLVKLRNKRVLVQFQDTLKENTTYSLDFGDAIVDNNESNPMGDYRYYFSTGDAIDTMRVGGYVYDAFTGKPLEKMYVLLYENHADSIPLKEVASYVGMTDTAGYFSITNIKQKKYRILAIEDLNRNYMFESPAEKVGFCDTLVYPVCYDAVHRDTLIVDSVKTDSVKVTHYTAYGPDNITMYLFQEEKTNQYMVNEERPQREKLFFAYSIPPKGDLKIDLLDIEEGDDWYIKERTLNNDTLNLWIRDSSVYKIDSIRAELKYLKTDTLGQLQEFTDTVDLNFTSPKPVVKKKKRKKNEDEEEQEKKKIEFLNVNFTAGSQIDIGSEQRIKFDFPVREGFFDSMHLYKMEDTLRVKQDFNIFRDSLKIREYIIDYKWQAGQKYVFVTDSASIYSIYGLHNKGMETSFSVKEVEQYGSIKLKLENAEGNLIVQVIKSKGKDEFSVVKSMRGEGSGEYIFKYMEPGEYSFRIIFDDNNNGKWDTGRYIERRQAERVVYFNTEIKVRENWDFEQTWKIE